MDSDSTWTDWLKSRGIWGAVITVVAGVFAWFNIGEASIDDQGQAVDYLVAIGAAAGGLIALLGRVFAKKKLTNG